MTAGDEPPAASRASGRVRTALTSFVGRRGELTEIKRRLTESRLVTLTGPGGVGKTRLALEVAERAQRGLRDGFWIVELGSVRDDSRVPQVITAALELPDQSSRDPVDKLLRYLRTRQVLIVLDNCEHLLDACARLAETVLRECASVRILATSREPLGLSGEGIYRVDPLSIPPAGQRSDALAVTQYEAVALLVDRVRHLIPDFEVTDENVDAVVQLCNRLDGIPLAIELAATRFRSLSATQIAQRLDHRFSLLTGGDRVALPRQQSLRALIDWSFDLCTKQEQLLWARLSVFPGTFDIEAAEQVCGFSGLEPNAVLDLLDRLVAKSIVVVERSGERVRYRQLMTVREYGADMLEALDESDVLKRRLRDHFLQVAARMVERWCGPHQVDDLSTMRENHANVLAALEWSSSTYGELDAATELATLLRHHWTAGGYLSEGRSWLDQLLHLGGMSSKLRGEALWVSAWVALMQGDRDVALQRLDECDRLAADMKDRELAVHAEHWRGHYEFVSGDIAGSIERFQRSIEFYETNNDDASVLMALFMLAAAQAFDAQLDAALATCRRVIATSERCGEKWNRAYALWITGLCQWHLGNDLSAARSAALEALSIEREFHDGIGIALTIELLSSIAASTSDFEQAAGLAGAASAIWARAGTDVTAFGLHLHRDSIHTAEIVDQALGAQKARSLREQRASMTVSAAVALAIGGPKGRPDAGTAPLAPLTKREAEVAVLVAEGLSNRAIAETLVLSKRTVDGHVEHILSKLDFTSRAQIAAWVASAS
jgi:predicted ATPase/DNA-binding NarL/FixJ family response regulator